VEWDERVQAKNRAVIESAIVMARETGAEAVVLAASLPEEAALLRSALEAEHRVITTAAAESSYAARDGDLLALPEVKLRRRGRAKIALLEGLAAGLLHQDERVVVISGSTLDGGCELDTIALVELSTDAYYLDTEADAPLKRLAQVADPAVFDAVLGLCVELGHTGREGKAVGLLVTLGDHETVLAHSHPIVLNPFEGHPERLRLVLNPQARRAVREFSGIDGAFIIRSDGIIEAAGRYLHPLAPADEVPSGLGARHRAAAGITGLTNCIAFAVSESTGDTRVFGGGHILMTIEGTD
jgi:DNA integrity scanning protein DisA with diadenylate cyclase activity